MKYSVLMSVYGKDNPDYLKLALESIFDNQYKKPDEIVVVFDGPLTDGLFEVLNDFHKGKESIVKYYPQSTNQGLGEALRIGSEYCTGDYIFRMDSDDISAIDRFKKQAEFIENHTDIDVLGTDIAEFNNSLDEKMRIRSCPEKHDDIVSFGKMRNPMNHVTVCIKKTALKKAGGYKPLPMMEDYYLWLRMIASGCKLANINEPLVYVRIGNGFEARRGGKQQILSRSILQKFMIKHNMISRLEAVKNIVYFSLFIFSPKSLKKTIYNKLLRE